MREGAEWQENCEIRVAKSERGFTFILCDSYIRTHKDHQRLASESSAVGDYDDSLDKPGSSFLWIGDYHHLNRDQVAELVSHLRGWLETGKLENKS
jgi:hypothetical protein